MSENLGVIEYIVRPDLSGMISSSRTFDREIKSMSTSLSKLAVSIAGVLSVGTMVSKLVSVSREFSVMTASLKTMTGSSENAAAAFGELESFAATTPYTLDQSVTAFTRLVSLGLNPSRKAMESYGNTASAMGKDLTQMIEAVADATTGEFERLKEFGIKASAQGDDVSFTFQGVTTTVKNNAKSIEGYLQSIGDVNFAGAMKDRMDTLDGALSNLEDSWNALFRSISSAGAGDLIKESAIAAAEALSDLTAMISSGEIAHLVASFRDQFSATFIDVSKMLDALSAHFTEKMADIGITGAKASSVLSSAFWEFPANVRAAIQIATVEFAGFVDKAAVYAKMLDAYLTPANWFDDSVDISSYFGEQLKQIDRAAISTTSTFLDERDKAIAKMAEERVAASALTDEYRKNKPSVDLSQFYKGSDAPATKSAAATKKLSDAIESNNQKIRDAALETQQLAIQYANLKIKEDGTIDSTMRHTAESAKLAAQQQLNKQATEAQVNALAREILAQDQLNQKYDEQKKAAEERNRLTAQFNPVQQAGTDYAKQQKDLESARALNLITEQQYQQQKEILARTYEQNRLAAAEELYKQQSAGNEFLMNSLDALGNAATSTISGLLSGTMSVTEAMQNFANIILNQAVGALVEMGLNYVKQQLLSQAMAAANVATASATGTAIAAAYAPAAAMASLASSLALAGGRRYGGAVNPGSMYQVNEGGAPEMLTVGAKQYLIPNARGEVVSNSDATGGSGGWTVINNNYASDVVSSSVSIDESAKTVTLAVNEVARQLATRTGPVSKGLQGGYNVSGRTA